jgi:hypothetical protein
MDIDKVNWRGVANMACLAMLGLIGLAFAFLDLSPTAVQSLDKLMTGLFAWLSQSAFEKPKVP